MKSKRKLLAGALAVLMAASSFAACKSTKGPDGDGGTGKYDPERDPVRFAIEGQDGVFNPFFSTTAYDSEITGQTQIGMLSISGKNATISCGDDQACVAKDYTETRLDANGDPVSSGSISNTEGFTEYAFLIKKGIKFSDGKELTIKDVLFNLYIYLDPVYTGSATIYSTDIVGLTDYQTQGVADDTESFNQTFVTKAEARIQAIVDYCQYLIYLENPNTTGGAGVKPATDEAEAKIKADIEILKTLFREELSSDWQSATESLEDMKKEYQIETVWQLFLYNWGVVNVETSSQTGYPIKENGKYKLDFSAYKSLLATSGKTEREFATEMVWNRYIEDDKGTLNPQGIRRLLLGSASSDKILEKFTAEAKSDYFNDIKQDGGLTVKSISGITTEQVTSFNGKTLDGTYDVLKILINRVDPKAIWNFAFTVAPMHYYSNQATIDSTPFGVEFASTDFMNNVVKDADKLGVPVGAGPYKASKQGGLADGELYPTKDKFCENNIIYYERNTYFETVGSGLCNAKIKYLRYQVINSAQTVATLATDGIDVGTPSGTAENITEIGKYSHLSMKEVDTNGYGYVGINPKFVPDINVRQAIMHAMNTALVLNYYPQGSCTRIFWPMSTTSWAYPQDNRQQPYYQYWTAEKILNFLKSRGYEQRTEDGKVMLGKKDEAGVWKQLKYTFTIPGTSNDHPANLMFEKAAQELNSIGFDISVKTDNWALKKLATGDLAVWAAAWSSTIDPDMYQVYHVDSNAGSTLNWGYSTIKANQDKYAEEYDLILELSGLIDAARSTTDQKERTTIYADALKKVMDLAVEMPTYQRKDLTVFNSEKIDRNTLTPDSEIGPNNGLFSRIWEMDYVK